MLRASRYTRELDQRAIAAKLGWSKSKYAAIESGEQQLKFLEFGQIAKVLDLDFLEFCKRYAQWLDQEPEFPPRPKRPRKK